MISYFRYLGESVDELNISIIKGRKTRAAGSIQGLCECSGTNGSFIRSYLGPVKSLYSKNKDRTYTFCVYYNSVVDCRETHPRRTR